MLIVVLSALRCLTLLALKVRNMIIEMINVCVHQQIVETNQRTKTIGTYGAVGLP